MTNELIPIQIIENKIFIIRGKKVMIDSDLAQLYEVETRIVNQAIKRNLDRFPQNFMFQVNNEEWQNLRSQFVISSGNYGGRRYLPYVFTEHGVLMLATVLNSQKAIAVSVQIVNAFVKLREMALANKDLSKRVDEIERTLISYARENNTNIEEIFQQLAYLHDITKPKQIGFNAED
ncbi:MAG: hypothetical protein A2039_09005 [Candidatus Melainabacteria bacterium GWA2_34_9]|nr:MAG: hypothetical protein A2039_09005 [Candidatus Melainabacteria bacterium GWA2_34_9]